MKMRGAKEIPEIHIELVPLIDCVFLLLIFFMCAATMAKVDSSYDMNLPVASNAAKQKEVAHRGTVNLLPIGTRTLKGEVVPEDRPFLVFGDLVDDEGLTKVITEKLKEDPNLRLYVRADRNVKFAMVRRAMAAAARGGVADVIFATHLIDLQLME